MLEKQIEAHLKKCAEAAGGEVRKVRWIGRRGAPDRIVMFPAASAWVELKAPGKKAMPHQVREHDRMRRVGQTVEIVDSIESAEALIDTLSHKIKTV